MFVSEEAQTLLSSGQLTDMGPGLARGLWSWASDQVPEPSQHAPFTYLSSSHSLWTSLPVTETVLTMIVKPSQSYFIIAETRAEPR